VRGGPGVEEPITTTVSSERSVSRRTVEGGEEAMRRLLLLHGEGVRLAETELWRLRELGRLERSQRLWLGRTGTLGEGTLRRSTPLVRGPGLHVAGPWIVCLAPRWRRPGRSGSTLWTSGARGVPGIAEPPVRVLALFAAITARGGRSMAAMVGGPRWSRSVGGARVGGARREECCGSRHLAC